MKTSDGFTLVELVVALLIFSIGVMGFIKMQGESIRGNAFSQQMSTALSLAQDKAEELVQLDYKNGSSKIASGSASATRNGVAYDLVWTVSSMGSSAAPSDVDLVVTWREKLLNHKVSLNFVTADNQVGAQ